MSERYVFSAARRELAADAFSAWRQEVVAVQNEIYRIDGYYEQHTRIETAREAPMWCAVEDLLRSGVGGENARVFSALADLRRYADVERRIHVMDLIDAREFETILTLKCADVRIARTLISSYAGRTPEIAELTFWSCYDECWELIEDLQDLDEDGHDWNFNFWLYLFMSKQPARAGVEAAAELLRRKLVALQDIYQRMSLPARYLCQAPLMKTLAVAASMRSPERRVLGAIANGDVLPFRELGGHADDAH